MNDRDPHESLIAASRWLLPDPDYYIRRALAYRRDALCDMRNSQNLWSERAGWWEDRMHESFYMARQALSMARSARRLLNNR